jgi:hypothetical protein
MLDFAPRSQQGDDWVYSQHPKVWKWIPRGCAMLRVTGPDDRIHLRWAVRSNRKFTGHEDEGVSMDSKLYTVTAGSDAAPDRAVITLKENGSVIHVAARDIVIDKHKATMVFIGSKKVHIGVTWTNDRAKFEAGVALFTNAQRHDLVGDMARTVYSLLNDKLIRFLADNRLVINSEFLSPSGSGPIDNLAVHGLKEATPFAFSMVNYPNRHCTFSPSSHLLVAHPPVLLYHMCLLG